MIGPRLVACLAAVGLAVTAGACGRQPTLTGPPLFLPRHDMSNGGPTAQLFGTLLIRDGCAWIATPDGGRDLVLWPQGTGLNVDAAGLITITGVPESPGPLRDGTQVGFGGGEYTDQAFVEQAIKATIPPECVSERYWLATTWTQQPAN